MKPAAPTRRRPWAMTTRLIALQLLVLVVLLGGALVTLYYTIASHLEGDNLEVLRNQTVVLSHWLEHLPASPGTASEEQLERNRLLSSLPDIEVRVLQADGSVLLEGRSTLTPPRKVFPAPGDQPRTWVSADHHRYLLNTVWLHLAGTGPKPLLQVAYSVADDDTLLRHLRQRMGLVFALVVIISGILTWLIARGVFRPLTQLAAATARVHASQLATRLDESVWPVELTPLAQEFDAMLGRLDESFGRLARFSSDLSHELRTPINNLRGEAEVSLSRARSAEEYRRVLESNLEECVRLGRLIDTLLFIAKADHPAEGIRRRRLDAAAECRAVAEFFEVMTAERAITILVRGTGTVHCDPELLRRALANLVDNAVRHSPAGGHIDLTEREHAGPGTVIEVRDNGAGIQADNLPRVFERFYRSENNPDQTPANSGFGLGLAIVKSIMDLHGGRVDLTSTPGVGTTVTLFFPSPAPAESDRNVI